MWKNWGEHKNPCVLLSSSSNFLLLSFFFYLSSFSRSLLLLLQSAFYFLQIFFFSFLKHPNPFLKHPNPKIREILISLDPNQNITPRYGAADLFFEVSISTPERQQATLMYVAWVCFWSDSQLDLFLVL